MTIWMDLTNSLVCNKGNVVGIVRTELMLAKELHGLDPSIKFSILTRFGFKEIKSSKLKWLFNSKNLNDDYIKFQNRKNKLFKKISSKIIKFFEREIFVIRRHLRNKNIFKRDFIIHPYKNNDIIYSCGWFGTKKEEFFSKIKIQLSNIKLIYTIYDLVMVKEDFRHLYYPQDILFDSYMKFISENCDYIIYGGHTAQIDAEKYFKKNNLNLVPGYHLKWGDNISLLTEDSDIIKKLNIKTPYILAVGTIDVKKNYDVLYRAYCKMVQNGVKNIPQLIIIGRVLEAEINLKEKLDRNPLIKDYIKVVSCSDKDLQKLYKNCLFTVLPTLYEGWSLTLPESLSYGKLCICSDIPPLREIGEGFAYFVNPNHPQDWIDSIEYFVNNKKVLTEYENNISKNWKSISWLDCAKHLYQTLTKINKNRKNEYESNKPVLYYDLSLFWFPYLSGIPRTQLLLARYLNRYNDNIKFFWMNGGKYCEFKKTQLFNLLSKQDLDNAIKFDKASIISYVRKKNYPFKKHDIVLSFGVGYDNKSYEKLKNLHTKIGFKYIQAIYDFTPITVPHTHPKERNENYPYFLKQMYSLSDFIFYGGKTAQKDGENFQINNGLTIKDSTTLKWGSDIVSKKHSKSEVETVMKKYGINGDFIISVGTIEARKNYETLYLAYLELLKDKSINKKLPQMVFCGHFGWKTEKLCHLLNVDNRTRGKIITISPSDSELDILYQNCKFTCLASFYEGWSLTLPESLNYGKFCLASDTPSLKETGEDIIDYANPYDPVEWAEKIKFYYTNKNALKQKEKLIKEKWHNTTWEECAQNITKILRNFMEK